MRIALILIVQLFTLCIFSQNENKSIIQNSEMASFFNSYDITKEIKEELNLNVEELKQQNFWNECDYGNYNFNKVWVKKEIGYLSEFIKSFGISNWNDMKLKFSELEKDVDVKSSYFQNVPNGYWDFGNYKGEFKNGKQEGEWILLKIERIRCLKDFENTQDYTGEKNDTSIVHEFYKNGIADGQWFRIKNNIKQNTFNFIDGKLDGEINIYGHSDEEIIFNDCKLFPTEIKMNFLNGIPNGNFTISFGDFIIRKGSYNLGIPKGKWEFSDIIETVDGYNHGYKLFRLDDYEIDEKYSVIKRYRHNTIYGREYYISDKDEAFKQFTWFDIEILVKDYKETDLYENLKIRYITYHGSDEFRNGKKEQEFYKNGKIKEEGIVNQYSKEYDINGKLIRSSKNFYTLSSILKTRYFGVH